MKIILKIQGTSILKLNLLSGLEGADRKMQFLENIKLKGFTFVKKIVGTIKLRNIRTFSYHGCLNEEGKIGSDYSVDLTIHADLSLSAETDSLEDTVDYVHLNKIVKDEMAIRSKLLETVAERILVRTLSELVLVKKVKVCVSKINPPIGGDVELVSVCRKKSR